MGLTWSLEHSQINIKSFWTTTKSIWRLRKQSAQLERENVANNRFGDFKWGEKSHGRGSPFLEHSQGERERVVSGVCARCHGVGLPWVPLGENAPLPGVHLEGGILPFQRQRACWVPLSNCSTAGDRGVHRGQITWSQLFTGLHHRLQAPTQPCHCFSGTEWSWAQHHEALLWGRRAGPHLVVSFKIWGF